MNIIDHAGIGYSDYRRALRFYELALAPLSITLTMEITREQTGGAYEGAGFGRNGKPSFWIHGGGRTSPSLHFAFVADKRADVDAFYQAALAAGATDNGPPGVRAHYHPNYYGAFVRDFDGHNIEAVCHLAE
jgi:catechol 2,3-dioxygenase-like lactoylglutathione lyase family enzyme